MSIYAFIFARGGSKGVPGKNIKPLAGKPLVGYAIELAFLHAGINKVFVSTDDNEIASVATELGAEVIKRPNELATDNASEWLAWQHSINYVRNKYAISDDSIFISLPTTSPLRNIEDIEQGIKTYQNNQHDLVLGICEAARSPYFNMVKVDQDNCISLVNKQQNFIRRQDVPQVYDITTVAYISSFEFIQNNTGLFDGKVGYFIVPNERALDIDTPYDFKIAEFLMTERLLNENLD